MSSQEFMYSVSYLGDDNKKYSFYNHLDYYNLVQIFYWWCSDPEKMYTELIFKTFPTTLHCYRLKVVRTIVRVDDSWNYYDAWK